MSFITSVNGSIPWQSMGITDAHNHVWIESVLDSNPLNPVLNNFEKIVQELLEYKQSGGKSIIDCQPVGCGRNGSMLAKLSETTGINIVSATGFHRPIYYPPGYWLWSTDSDKIADFFIQEIESGELETLESERPVKAGFIKIACEETLEKTYQPALYAAAQAACMTAKAIQIHTEKGQSAVEILTFFSKRGVDPHQIILCHMDKRPDVSLHKELAQSGAALEYDTFFRSKYQPETYLWPLIQKMVDSGYENSLCLATDMAEESFWTSFANGPGLKSLPTQIKRRLLNLGLTDVMVNKLTGNNICRILAGEKATE